jgi:hypothetical protein
LVRISSKAEGKVCKGRKEERLGMWGRPLHLQIALLRLSVVRLVLLQPHVGGGWKKETPYLGHLGGWPPARRRKFWDAFDKRPAPHRSDEASSILSCLSILAARESKPRAFTMFSKERFKHIARGSYA